MLIKPIISYRNPDLEPLAQAANLISAPPPVPPTPQQSAVLSIVESVTNPIAAVQATDNLMQYGIDNGLPSWWRNAVATNYTFWNKWSKIVNPRVDLAWDAYKLWLNEQVEIDKIATYDHLGISSLGYGNWWVAVGHVNFNDITPN